MDRYYSFPSDLSKQDRPGYKAVYFVGPVDKRIQELEGAIGRWKIEEKAWNETETQLRKALEEIQVEVRKPERIPRDIEKWLKRADKRTKLKKIDDIATEALGGEKKEEENDKG